MTDTITGLGEAPRLLVARTDRIGDLVLSLPVFASLRRRWPRAHITALTRSYGRELLEGRADVDQIIAFDAPTAHIPSGEIRRVAGIIRAGRFDAAIILYSNFTVALTVTFGGVPIRIGPATKLAQIFLTHRVTQRRAHGARHEADHNLDLLAPLGVGPVREAVIPVTPAPRRPANQPVIGVHPGHGGSSRNWPESNWAELIRSLTGAGALVVITGSPAERELAERINRMAGGAAQLYIGERGLMALAAELAAMDVFIASSTGPLHIASAAGTPVVGVYCPITVCLPERWGPIGPNDTALRPDVPPCPECVGGRCEYYDCMERVTVEQVRDAALAKVKITAGA